MHVANCCIFTEIVFNIPLAIRPIQQFVSVFLFSLLSCTRCFTLLFSLGIYLAQIQLLVEVARVIIYPWPSKVLGTKVLGRQYLLCLFFYCGLFKYNNQQNGFERSVYEVRCLKSTEDMIVALTGQFKQLSHEWVSPNFSRVDGTAEQACFSRLEMLFDLSNNLRYFWQTGREFLTTRIQICLQYDAPYRGHLQAFFYKRLAIQCVRVLLTVTPSCKVRTVVS